MNEAKNKSLEEWIRDWASNDDERTQRWSAELKRNDIDDIEALECLDDESFDVLISALKDRKQALLKCKKLKFENVERKIRESGEINLKSEVAILEFMERFMVNVDQFNCDPHIVGDFGRSFKLSGRDTAVKQAAQCFKNMLKLHGGRENRAIPVCSGISGLGKTRMLEEWETIFDQAQIAAPRLGVLVPYYNGNSPLPIEKTMTIEASFSWRLLHRLFLDGNGPKFSTWFENSLPVNAAALSLANTLLVIRLRSLSRGIISKDDILNLFIGIDEYQAIDRVGGIQIVKEQGLLQDLLDSLGAFLAKPLEGIRIFPMFAGTDFSIMSISTSSRTETIRMSMTFLSAVEVECAIASVPHGLRLLGLSPVRRHLFYFGGVARWSIRYIEILIQNIEELGCEDEVLPLDVIEKVFQSIKLMYVTRWSEAITSQHSFMPIDFIVLAAYSLSGTSVEMNGLFNGKVSWSRLRDSSVCLIDDASKVVIPYALYHLIASHDFIQFKDLKKDIEIKYLLLTLKSMFLKVDELIYDKAPWQLWEVFGAHYHALRINALLILGIDQLLLSELFSGALVNGCNILVQLKPMLVMETEDVFTENISARVSTKGYCDEKKNWLEEGWIVINGESGKGVDLFFSLSIYDKKKNEYVVITDQRKRSAKSMGHLSIENLIKKARITPKCCGKCITAACIFSSFSSSQVSIHNLPENSCFISYNQTRAYHGSLWIHPVASPTINVNRAPLTYLKMLFKGKDCDEFCHKILNFRSKRKFLEISEVEEFVRKSKMQFGFRDEYHDRLTFS